MSLLYFSLQDADLNGNGVLTAQALLLVDRQRVSYTDSTIDTWTANGVTQELPEIDLAFER